jgi:endo-1,4-beta-xylanase
MIGAALHEDQFLEKDTTSAAIVKHHFNTISPENVLKWESVHPAPNAYTFAKADRYVCFGQENNMCTIGHVLIWHQQTPAWVFEDDQGNETDRETLLQRMREHIRTVVGRYKGTIHGWDVVNEALNEDGSLRETPWLRIIGHDYIAKAFAYAHQADPDAELYYNDYNLENEAKCQGAVCIIQQLRAQNIPITAVGMQGHSNLVWPSLEQLEKSINRFAKLGIQVHISELDVDVLPARQHASDAQADILTPAMQSVLAQRYADLFNLYVKHAAVKRVTFWGVTDKYSWLNNWPLPGRVNHPLLFDRNGNPKIAYQILLNLKSSCISCDLLNGQIDPSL